MRSCGAPSSCGDPGEDIALLMTLEMGKPLVEARAELTYGAEFLRWFSEEPCGLPAATRWHLAGAPGC